MRSEKLSEHFHQSAWTRFADGLVFPSNSVLLVEMNAPASVLLPIA